MMQFLNSYLADKTEAGAIKMMKNFVLENLGQFVGGTLNPMWVEWLSSGSWGGL